MQKVRLGRTGLMVSKPAFGVLPLQRTEMNEAVYILRKAYDAGINFFDTARAYTDSEEKIGRALSSFRKDIILATKTQARRAEQLEKDLITSLNTLKTDYIDIYQWHNAERLPAENDPESLDLYAAMVRAKEQGQIRFIGITCHRRPVALEAVRSGLFDTVQFPLSYLADNEDLRLVQISKEADVGFIAMKGLSGGLITNIPAAVAYLNRFDHVVPIWGIQRVEELDVFLQLAEHPPLWDETLQAAIDKDRAELSGEFCRGCGYCLPCPAEIPIPWAARMALLLQRAPYQIFLEEEWRERMSKIEDCTDCGNCKTRCPYHLDTPALLRENLDFYRDFYTRWKEGTLPV